MTRTSRIILAAAIAVTLGLSVQGEAMAVDLPKIIQDGFEAYRAEGAEAAVTKWLAGSPILGSPEAALIPGQFKQLETVYGSYRGFEVFRVTTFTPSTSMVYLIIKFERGPFYGSFHVYNREGQEWIVITANFSTNPEKILPSSIF